MNDVKEAASAAASAIDGGMDVASAATRQGLAVAKAGASQAYTGASELLLGTRSQLDEWLSYAKQKEDVFFNRLKGGVEYCIANPYIAYPAAGTALFLSVPGIRRYLRRYTVAAIRSPEAILKNSEERVGVLKVKVEEFSKEAEKLQNRMLHAEEEMLRGRSKLKATRAELQRLSTVVGSNHKSATDVLNDLRIVKKLPTSVELRSQAAQEAAALLAQKAQLDKHIFRIAKRDI